MDSANQNRQSLVYADGYSYTEIFQAPELPGMPSGNHLISVFHAFFSTEQDNEMLASDPVAVTFRPKQKQTSQDL